MNAVWHPQYANGALQLAGDTHSYYRAMEMGAGRNGLEARRGETEKPQGHALGSGRCEVRGAAGSLQDGATQGGSGSAAGRASRRAARSPGPRHRQGEAAAAGDAGMSIRNQSIPSWTGARVTPLIDRKVIQPTPSELMEDTGTGLDYGTPPDRMPGYLVSNDRFVIRSHAATPTLSVLASRACRARSHATHPVNGRRTTRCSSLKE